MWSMIEGSYNAVWSMIEGSYDTVWSVIERVLYHRVVYDRGVL